MCAAGWGLGAGDQGARGGRAVQVALLMECEAAGMPWQAAGTVLLPRLLCMAVPTGTHLNHLQCVRPNVKCIHCCW